MCLRKNGIEINFSSKKINPRSLENLNFKHFFLQPMDGPNLKNISCYSNEQNQWRKSKLAFYKKNELKIILDGKFTTERGRINCSLREDDGSWRWLGIQFVIANL